MARHTRCVVELEQGPEDLPDQYWEYEAAEGLTPTEAYEAAQKLYPKARIIGHHLKWWDD